MGVDGDYVRGLKAVKPIPAGADLLRRGSFPRLAPHTRPN
jgi:hypothetical protein